MAMAMVMAMAAARSTGVQIERASAAAATDCRNCREGGGREISGNRVIMVVMMVMMIPTGFQVGAIAIAKGSLGSGKRKAFLLKPA